jgi:hypothetical protein
MYSISKYLNTIGFNLSEGYCEQIPQQINDLVNLISKPNFSLDDLPLYDIFINIFSY